MKTKLAFAMVALLLAAARADETPGSMPEPGAAPEPGAMPPPVEGVPKVAAEGEPTVETDVKVSSKEKSLDHRKQAGLSVVIGSGYRAIFPYKKNGVKIPCSDDPMKSPCTGRAPATIDLGLSYGLTTDIEALVEMRLGIEKQTFTNSHTFVLAPGIRVYFDNESALKFFLTVQAMIDFTDFGPVADKTDYGERSALGVQYDFMRHFGLFVQGAMNLGVSRSFTFEGDLGVGVQARFP